MNLAIDIGNSFSKIGAFDIDDKLFVTRIPEITSDLIIELIHKYNVDKLIYSSLSDLVKIGEKEIVLAGASVHKLTYRTALPFKIDYTTPETLGADRLAGIAAAHNKFIKQNVLVIDAGTAMTFDVLSSDGIYKGGNISPGLSMRFRALNSFTSSLPLVTADYKYDIIAKDTEGAIRSGVQQGLIFEINEYIRNLKKLYPGLEVIVTGGDGKMLSEKIGSPVILCPDLVLEGLNYIVNYNA